MQCQYCLKAKPKLDHKCRSIKTQSELDSVKDKIVQLLDSGHATNFIAINSKDLLGFKSSNQRIIFFCKRHNIKRRTIKEAANSAITRNLYRKTVEKLYGPNITNVSQSERIKEKKINVNLERYGVENPFQREEVKEKSKATMLERFGVEHPIHIADRKNANGRLSKPHKKISDYLTEINVDHINDFPGKFMKFNEVFQRKYSPIPDIFIPEKNIVIEIYGDRWHMNPQMYTDTDVVRFFDGEKMGKECWEHDKIRIDHLTSFGVEVIIIWESEIKKDFSAIKQLLREKLCDD